ncbi:L,D-transpeptidase family protein [Clostridium sp. AF37-7]|uniref:L,D-transpeptidase family protein n=1 Tax=Clostridium sp. AF37-7 TaxID=2293017 RepID=UPI000E51ABAB|nr:peptidoglycan-binding protein [Clostridium sp. AF37-7]
MTDRNGNLNKNSRSGSREDGREPVRRNTAMNSREIMLEDEDYLDEPDEGYLDDDYFDRDMEERILREAELDMENIHQPERQDQNRWEEPERLPEKEPEETASRKRSRARGNQSAGTGREAAHAAPQRGQDSGKTASWTEATPEKAALKAEHRKNGKKAAWIAACTAGILLVAAGGVYVGMSQKYKTRFFPNTQINGVDASGKTAAEVQELIAEGVNGYTLTIDERNNQTETIAGTDIKLHAEFDGSLEKMVAAQNPFAWLWHMKQEEYTIGTMVAYDDAALESQIRNLSCLDPEKAVEPVNAKISEYVSGQGYSIEPEQEGTAVEAEKLTQAVTGAIENLQDHLSLEEADVYKKPTVLKDDASLAEQLDKMNKYAKMSVTYQFGDSTETLNGDQIHAWLIANADGSVSVDSSKVSEYVSEMAKAHNTSNKAKTLKTSYGSTIQVSGGTYGWKINQAAETEALAAIIASGESTTREPEYSQKAASHGANDYGDTYVEINLTGQHLFFYKEGKLVVESDFVSGNLAKGWGTPAGSYPLAYKQKNAVLKGENYRTPVNYWMPFNNGIGMHDAKWRSSFGGTIYKTGGSHGCINLPPSVAKTIFDNISAGTPVICYNLPGTEKSTTSGTAKPAETKRQRRRRQQKQQLRQRRRRQHRQKHRHRVRHRPQRRRRRRRKRRRLRHRPGRTGRSSGDNGGNIAVGPGA